jgi:signal transduction histidine kinase
MRWRIRWQLLVPPLTLLAGVAGISLWLAVASAEQARRQIEERVRAVARNLAEETSYPLSENVLRQMKRLSGADYVLVPREGPRLGTLPGDVDVPSDSGAGDDWQTLRLGPPVSVGGSLYRGSSVRLTRPPRDGGTLYILYPEAQWRDARWEAMWPVLALGSLAGLASLGLAAGLGRGLSRRVGDLERRTRLIAAGDFSPMPLPARDDEIRDLARSVNEMAARLARLQDAIRRAERLRLLGQVSGGLAHQLRNGLAGARLALQQFARELPRPADTAALDVALRQLTLLETNLKRFLDLGREDHRREPCDLARLVSEAVELLRPQCRHAGIDLRWQPPALPLTICGDSGQLGQLVHNLLGNAVDAAGPGGWVKVEMQNAECRMQNGKPDAATSPAFCILHSAFCILEVSDSGPGPGADVADRLFEPFVTGKPEGVGLGLAVARQVAEAHGGGISWSRASGHTCFRVELPAAAAVRAGAAEMETAQP